MGSQRYTCVLFLYPHITRWPFKTLCCSLLCVCVLVCARTEGIKSLFFLFPLCLFAESSVFFRVPAEENHKTGRLLQGAEC